MRAVFGQVRHQRPIALSVARTLLGLLGLAALGAQLAIHVRMGASVVNFFSYFTNLSNLFAALVLLLMAYAGFSGRGEAEARDQIRAISAVNMAVVGIVFSALLRHVDLGALLPWVNVVLHYVMPCLVVLDWLLQPPAYRLQVRHLMRCLIFPALYLAYVLIRGAAVNWYPYPFFNPAHAGGYSTVASYSVGIALTFLVTGWLLLFAGNRARQGRDSASASRSLSR